MCPCSIICQYVTIIHLRQSISVNVTSCHQTVNGKPHNSFQLRTLPHTWSISSQPATLPLPFPPANAHPPSAKDTRRQMYRNESQLVFVNFVQRGRVPCVRTVIMCRCKVGQIGEARACRCIDSGVTKQ